MKKPDDYVGNIYNSQTFEEMPIKPTRIRNYMFCFSYYAEGDTIKTHDTHIICTDDDGRLSMDWIAKKIGLDVGEFTIESIQEI